VIVTPGENCWCVDIPCKVEKHVAIRQTCAQELINVFLSDTTVFPIHAKRDEICNAMSIIDEVNNRDGVRVYANITNKKWESALGNSAATENENAAGDMAGL
jgi:hypothetical protein